MKKRLLAIMLVLSVVATMIPFMGITAFADMTQDEKNVRTSVASKDGNGMYLISANWNRSEVYFNDESHMQESTMPDASADNFIQRMSSSEQMSAGLYGYMMLPTWGGSISSSATKADYAAGNFWYQMDFGIPSKVTRIDYWTSFYNDWVRSTYASDIAQRTPKQFKVLWSNDKVNWNEKTFDFDYTDPSNPMYTAYADVLENGANSTYLGDFKYGMQLTFDTPAKGRYFRLAITAPTMDFDLEVDSTSRVTSETHGLMFYDTSEPDWEGLGSGTEIDPYLISTPQDVQTFSTYVANDRIDISSKFFKVANNIDMYGVDFTPIGASRAFTGTLDGNGKVISNLSIGSESSPYTQQYAGLFAHIGSGGVVKNLGVENATIYVNCRDARIAPFVADAQADCEIRNCYVKDGYSHNAEIGVGGGFAAQNYGSIYDCAVVGTNEVYSYREGGFFGDSNGSARFYNCYTAGVSMPAGSVHAITAAAFQGSHGGATIDNCYYLSGDGKTDTVGTAFAAEEMADGTLNELLNNGSQSSGITWLQEEGDPFPKQRVFSEGSAPVTMQFIARDISYEPYELKGTYYDDVGNWSMSNINDHNTGTSINDQGAKSITLDLGEGIYGSVSYVEFVPLVSTNWWFAAQLVGARLQGSVDGAVYETLGVVETSEQGTNRVILDSPSYGYRYLRWLPAEGTTMPLAELHWYGQTNATVSYHGTHLGLNTRYTVKNNFDVAKTARNFLAVFDGDEYKNVESNEKAFAANTVGEAFNNRFVKTQTGMPFTLKSMLWNTENIQPLANALEYEYIPGKTQTEFALPNYFCNGMVFQRNKDINVFGKAYPSTQITVELNTPEPLTATATANASGNWSVALPPQAKGGPYTLTISSSGQTKVIDEVYIGEVFICSGQSNMEFNWNNWGWQQDPTFIDEIEANPHIKFLTGAGQVNSGQGQRFDLPVSGTHGWGPLATWQTCNADNAKTLSEVGYKVAKELTKAEPDLYVGLIGIAVGGAPIENWSENGSYYDALLAPFKGYNIGAFLWYQGESNAPGTYYGTRFSYVNKMTTLVNHYREFFDDEDLPFIYAQLARHIHWWDTPYLQDEQRRVLDSDLLNNKTNIGMAVTIDTDAGSGAHPTQNTAIHPAGKAIVGSRMADLYKKIVWGQDIVATGPLYESHTIDGDSIVVKFSDTSEGLAIKDVDNGSFDYSPDNSALVGTNTVCEFEIAGADGTFVAATAEIISANEIRVSADGITEPKFVRYAMSSAYPLNPNLANKTTIDGVEVYLPASPFTTQWD